MVIKGKKAKNQKICERRFCFCTLYDKASLLSAKIVILDFNAAWQSSVMRLWRLLPAAIYALNIDFTAISNRDKPFS